MNESTKMDTANQSKMVPTKQKHRDQRLSNKEKSLKRRRERDRKDNHVQKMFSEALHEHTEAGLVTNDLKRRGAVAFQKVWRSYVVRMVVNGLEKQRLAEQWRLQWGRQTWYKSESDDGYDVHRRHREYDDDYWHDDHRRQREDDNDDALRRGGD